MKPQGSFKYPFGAESCEHELQILKQHYPDYYYSLGRFPREALDPDNYLFVGRRGSGKTSLTRYFEFQDQIAGALAVDVCEPEVYDEIYQQIALRMEVVSRQMRTVAVTGAARLWRFVIWSLIFHRLHALDASLLAASYLDTGVPDQAGSPTAIVRRLFARLQCDEHGDISAAVDAYLASAAFDSARRRALDLTRTHPVIVAVDSMEHYDKNDEAMMVLAAALIQCASEFNVEAEHTGISVKVFVAAEIFPHLKEHAILNPAKYARDPVYLQWWPRDLIHLVAWRFGKYLAAQPELAAAVPNQLDWTNFEAVLEGLWYPYFGRTVTNKLGVEEQTFPYLLRHTQMRPRQLVQICNAIAKEARRQGYGVQFWRVDIPQVMRTVELELADEVINSFAEIHPYVSAVVDALDTLPSIFRGSELDRVAKATRAAWPRGEYSLEAFRTLVAELGIVGRVRKRDPNGCYVLGDFEYALPDRLPLRSEDECVIHPMFYGKLHTTFAEPAIVFPFPDHKDFGLDTVRWVPPSPPAKPPSKPAARTVRRRKRPAQTGRSRTAATPLPGPLTPAQQHRLQQALLHAFDRGELVQMTKHRLGVDLDAVAGSGTLADVVFALVQWAERQGHTRRLVAEATAANPGNPFLQQFARSLQG